MFLHLHFFASSTEFPQSYGFRITVLSVTILIRPSSLNQAHHKHSTQNAYGGPGEALPLPSEQLFSSLHTTILFCGILFLSLPRLNPLRLYSCSFSIKI